MKAMLSAAATDAIKVSALLLAAPLCIGALCGSAAAANASAETNTGLEEIVVTAEKRNSTVQETAISMTAISGDQLKSQGLQTVEDLVGTVPGISLRTSGPGQTEYEMRGLGSSGGSTATVGFYLDETPLSASAVALNGRTVIDADLFDLNHVEVLRGPQGTLYGAGSMGGTIKLVTNPPKLSTFEGAASVDLSQTDGGGTNGGGNLMLNFPIGDKAALRFVTTDKYISGWIDRKVIAEFPFPTNFGNCGFYFCTRGDVADSSVTQDIKGSNLERFVSARATLLVNPVDELSITGTLMYQRIDADGYNAYQTPPGVGGYAIYQPYDIQEPYLDTFKLASLKVNYDMDIVELTSATSYWKRDVVQSQDSTEPLQNIFNFTTFIPTVFQEEDPTTQISEELRLSSTGAGPWQWVGGLYITDLHSGYVTTEQSVAFANATSCVTPYSGGSCPASQTYNPNAGGAPANPEGIVFNDNNPNVTKQQAIFGEVSYKFNSDWKLTTGLRFFKFDVANISNQRGLGTGTANATPSFGSAHGSGTGILPKVNLAYTPTSDLTIYGTVSKGARPGGVNLPIPLPTQAVLDANPAQYDCGPGTATVPPAGPVFVTSQPAYYGPDSIWSVEVGEKARFADRRFTVNADFFYVKWSDIQQVIALSCGYPYNTNAGGAKSYGPELEVSAKLTNGLSVDLSGAYTQAYIDAPTIISISPGTRILNVPKYTGSLAFNYETMLAGELKGTARIADAYVGPVSDVAYDHETLSPYSLVDARAGVAKNALTAYLFATNLTNKHAGLTINNTTFAWQQSTITRFSTNQPRTIGLEYQIKF